MSRFRSKILPALTEPTICPVCSRERAPVLTPTPGYSESEDPCTCPDYTAQRAATLKAHSILHGAAGEVA